MQLKLFKTYFLGVVISISVLILGGGCKKDQLTVDQTKEYRQLGHVPTNAYDGGWVLILQPNGVADVNPRGDILYRGTYKIIGSKIKVQTPKNSGSYVFEILSETEIREKIDGMTLALR